MPFMNLETGVRVHHRDGGSDCPIVFVPGLRRRRMFGTTSWTT